MLALLSHVLNRWSIDVLSGRHRRNLDPSVSYALCGDKLLIQLGLGGALLHDLDDRLFLSESANDVKVLGLDHVILLSLQEMLGLLLLQVHLLLKVETRARAPASVAVIVPSAFLVSFFELPARKADPCFNPGSSGSRATIGLSLSKGSPRPWLPRGLGLFYSLELSN